MRSIIPNDEERPESPKLDRLTSSRNLALKKSILNYKNSVPSPSSLRENEVNSFISSIVVPINDSLILTEYDLEKEDWESLLTELKSPSERQDSLTELENFSKTIQDKTKNDIAREYGDKKRNALMTILVCHPPLEVVKLVVELGGHDTVMEVDGGCGFNAIHYACWGNASLEVIKYLLDIGGKKALLEKSKNAGANPLHLACLRYKTTESNSLCDIIRLLIEVGEHDVITDIDFNGEIPLQGLLLRPEMPVESVITFFEIWYELEKTGGTVLPDISRQSIGPAADEKPTDNFIDEKKKVVNNFKRIKAFNSAFKKITGQLLKMDYDERSQILKTEFMRKYLTEKFIEPLPLAILIIDVYIQGLIVCVFSWFINNTPPNLVDSATITTILGICVFWRLFRELMQLMTTSLGNYISDIFNWFDITQIVLLISTMCMDLDDHSANADRWMLTFATFYAWFELLLVLHAFNYDLAIFVVATIKIMERLRNFLITTLIFIASFAHMYYIAGTHDEEFCNNVDKLTVAEFDSIGGFTCTRKASYIYAVTNLFTFQTPTGVPRLLPFLYAFVMLILVMNVVIAVVVTAFEEVLNESDMSFWSDRLITVNELGSFFSFVPRLLLTSFPNLIECRLLRRYQRLLGYDTTERSDRVPRINLNLLLPTSDWDRIKNADKLFIHWWYGKIEKDTSLSCIVRLKFFITKSRFEDIFMPGSVLENVLLGKNRSHRSNTFEKLTTLPASIFLLVVSNIFLLTVFISGLISFGLLWPKKMKRKLFSANNEKKKIIPEIKKKNKEMSEMREENKKMRVEIQDMREEMKNNALETREEMQETREEIKNNMQNILSEIKSSHTN